MCEQAINRLLTSVLMLNLCDNSRIWAFSLLVICSETGYGMEVLDLSFARKSAEAPGLADCGLQNCLYGYEEVELSDRVTLLHARGNMQVFRWSHTPEEVFGRLTVPKHEERQEVGAVVEQCLLNGSGADCVECVLGTC
jgi:hypothetical protein